MSWFSRLCLNSQARFPSKSLFEIYAVDATLKSDSRRAVARGKEKEPQMRPLRVRVDGKHLAVAGEPFRVRGVTYGSFGTRADGAPYPEPGCAQACPRAGDPSTRGGDGCLCRASCRTRDLRWQRGPVRCWSRAGG